MNLCIYSFAIGIIVTTFATLMIWASISYGKHLGRTEKKEKRTGV